METDVVAIMLILQLSYHFDCDLMQTVTSETPISLGTLIAQ